MSQKISKKSIKKPIIVTLVLAAVISLAVLIYGLIISGTAEKMIRRIEFEFNNWRDQMIYPTVEMNPIDSLKPGKYLLEREWGLDETDYIEVFDDFTLRFVGEYWIDRKNENLAQDPDYYSEPEIPDRTERIPYEMYDTVQLVQFSEAVGGFAYADENTLIISRIRDEKDDVVDHEYSLNKDPERVDAYYIYAE